MPQERLANTDYALLRLDSPENRMIVTGLMILRTRLTRQALEEILLTYVAKQQRFRQMVQPPRSPWGKAYWEDDPTFSLSNHLTLIKTPLPGDASFLEEVVSRIMGLGMNFKRPLWQMFLIEQYGAGSALVVRLHHCIADGMAMVNLLTSLTQTEQGAAPNPEVAPPAPMRETQPGHERLDPPTPGQFLSRMVGVGRQTLIEVGSLEDSTRHGAGFLTALGKLVFSAPESNSPFRGQTARTKRAAWSPGVPVERVKFIGKVYSCKLNDVMLSAVSGAVRRYLLERRRDPGLSEIHSFVPIDLRRNGRREQIQFMQAQAASEAAGNQFGFAIFTLPIHIADPVSRLKEASRSMDSLKASSEALVSYLVLNLVGALPGEIEKLALRYWDSKGSAVMTNVAGPREQLYLGGAAIETLMCWVPQSGALGLGVSIFSYNRQIVLGIATDEGLAPEPERIVDYFLEEFDELYNLAKRAQEEQVSTVSEVAQPGA